MKIAVVSGDDLVGDDPQQLCTALAARGYEATAYLRQRGRGRLRTGADGCRTVPISVGPRAAAPTPDVLPYVGQWAAALERKWSADQPDVVHAYSWLGGLAAQLAARRQQIPTVQTFQGLAATSGTADGAQQESERDRIEPLLARSATWVTGECTADVDAIARLRRGRTRVSILAGGVDVERYSPVGPAAPRTDLHRILCLVPNPLWHNGIDIAIKALPRVPGAELIIAETDSTNHRHDQARARLESLAASLGVADRVRFAGTVAESGLPMLVRSADVVACTPRQPPRATTVLRAMASGVVVVTLAVGVLTDAVVDNVTGFVLSTDRPGELAAVLRNVLAQSFQCESMGAAGRSRALSRFSWERIALDALNIYRQIGLQHWAPSALQSAAR